MQVHEVAETYATLTLTRNELTLVTNALNEICNGVSDLDHDGEFNARVGTTRDAARHLLREVHATLERLRRA